MDFKGENIDKIFREGLKDFEVAPPSEVWEGVKQAHSYKKKRILPVFRYAAAAVVMLFVAGSLYTIINKSDLQQEAPRLTQNTTVAENNINETAEKPQIAKVRIAEAQVNMVKPESEEVLSDRVVQIPEPVNITDDEITIPGSENYNSIESKSLSPFIDKKTIIINSKFDYTDRGLYANNNFVNETTGPEIRKPGTWSIGAKFSPLYTFRDVTMSMPGNFKEMYNNVEEGMIAFSGGFNFKYKSTGRISINTGLFFSRMGQKITDLVSYDVPSYIASTLPVKGSNKLMINSSFGTIVVPETNLYIQDITVARVESRYSSDFFDPAKLGLEGFEAEISQSFEFIEIPLLVSYKVIDRIIDFQLLGGVSTNMLINNNAFAEFNGQRISLGQTGDINKFNYSGIVGFGVEYGFSDQLSISIEPTFKYSLNSLSSGIRLHVHPFSVGLFSGVSYKF